MISRLTGKTSLSRYASLGMKVACSMGAAFMVGQIAKSSADSPAQKIELINVNEEKLNSFILKYNMIAYSFIGIPLLGCLIKRDGKSVTILSVILLCIGSWMAYSSNKAFSCIVTRMTLDPHIMTVDVYTDMTLIGGARHRRFKLSEFAEAEIINGHIYWEQGNTKVNIKMDDTVAERKEFFAFVAGDKTQPKKCNLFAILPETLYYDFVDGKYPKKDLLSAVTKGDESQVRLLTQP